MADGYRNSAAVDASALYDPDVVGDGYNATWLRRTDGTTLKYALAKYGTAGSVLGQRDSGGADVGPKWAAKGTASYALPINGQTYTQSTNITSGNTGYTQIGFRIVGGATWQVFGYNSITATTSVLASGGVPTGAANVKYTWGSYVVGSSKVDAGGSTSNGAASSTAISGNPQAVYTTNTNTATSGSRDREYPFTVDFFNSGGSNISHSVCTLIGDTEGSV